MKSVFSLQKTNKAGSKMDIKDVVPEEEEGFPVSYRDIPWNVDLHQVLFKSLTLKLLTCKCFFS